MCDVALGDEKKLFRSEFVENLEKEFQSVRGCGSHGPDFKTKKVVAPQGYCLPMGGPIKYDEPSQAVIDALNAKANPGGLAVPFGGFGGLPFGGKK